MPIQELTWGMSDRLAQILQQQRDEQRKAEDQSLQYQQELIKSLINRPDFNPEYVGQAMHDMIDMANARGGTRRPQKGAKGIFGATELPISQFLKMFQQGLDPSAQAQAQGFDGKSVTQSPIPVPPPGTPVPQEAKGMLDAGQQMQAAPAAPQAPAPTKPHILFTPDEMALQRGRAEAEQYKGRQKGQLDADIDILRGLGVPEDQIQEAMRRKIMGGGAVKTFARQTQNVILPGQTQPIAVQFDPATGDYYAADGVTKIALPSDARRVSTGPTIQHRFITQPDGSVVDLDASPYLQGVLGAEDTGVQGRVQFTPQTQIRSYDPVTGLETTTPVNRPVVPTRPLGTQGAIGVATPAGTDNPIPPAPPVSTANPVSPAAKPPTTGRGVRNASGNPKPPQTMANGSITVTQNSDGSKTYSSMKSPTVDETARRTITSIRTAKSLAQDLVSYIEQHHLQNDNNKLDAWLASVPYKFGIDPGQAEQFLQNLGIQEVNQLVAYMGGQRGQYWTNILQQHTAQPGNTYALAYKKAKNMISYDNELEKELNTTLLSRPTTNGFQVPSTARPNQTPSATIPRGTAVKVGPNTYYSLGTYTNGKLDVSKTPPQ